MKSSCNKRENSNPGRDCCVLRFFPLCLKSAIEEDKTFLFLVSHYFHTTEASWTELSVIMNVLEVLALSSFY